MHRRGIAGVSGSGVRRSVVAGAVGLGIIVVALVASADDAAPPAPSDPPPGIAVRIGAVRPGTSVAVESTDGDDDNGVGRVVTRCFEDCETIVDPGHYRLRVFGADGETVGTKSVSIKRPIAFELTHANPTAGTAGLVTGISGLVLLASGVAVFGIGALSSMCEASNCGGAPEWVPIYALTAIPVGIIATSLGWGLWARNRRLFRSKYIVDRPEKDDPDAREESPPFRIGLAPGPQGVTGSFTLSF
jgi:hypothetical protein